MNNRRIYSCGNLTRTPNNSLSQCCLHRLARATSVLTFASLFTCICKHTYVIVTCKHSLFDFISAQIYCSGFLISNRS